MKLDPRRRRLEDEMSHHLEELEAHLRCQGMSREEARAEARRRFGDPQRHASDAPVEKEGSWRERLESFGQDLRHGLRQARLHPLSTGLVVATLAIGVAATTVVYSLVDAVVLAPLPFAAPDEVVHVSQTSPQGRLYSTSEPNFVDFRARQRSFVEMAAMGWETPILSGLGDPVSIDARRVSHTFFPVLGIDPELGRNFLETEDRFGGASDVALLSAGSWRRRFGADPEVLGRTVVLDGTPREIVGVVPSDQAWPGVEVFLPLAPNPDVYRDDQRLETVARLAPGVTLEEAREDMARIAAELSGEYPESNDGWGAAVRPVREWLVGERLTRMGNLLLGAVALFLLMACASVSNLLVAQSSARTREMGVRSALGAPRGRIATQLMAEGTVMACMGAALALAMATAGLRLAKAVGPGDVPRLAQASLDATALGVAMAALVLTVGLAGLAPALLLARTDRHDVLRSGGRTTQRDGRGLRNALVVAQFALAVTVVTGAGLLARSFVELTEVDLGFDASSVVGYTVRLPDDRFDQRDRSEYIQRLRTELLAVPGVEAVGGTTVPPFATGRPSNFVARSDDEPDRQASFLPVSWRAVTPGYFQAAGIRLVAGRFFRQEDLGEQGRQPANPSVIIDELLARALFPSENPVGQRVTWFLPGGQQCIIVGVVATARDERLAEAPRPRIYRPFTLGAWSQPAILVRTSTDPGTLIAEIREATLRVDGSTPAIDPVVVSQDARDSIAWPRFGMQVLAAFGVVALLLAAMGIYGVTAFFVARHRHEIGVRMALGADPQSVRRMVVLRTVRLAALGIGVGLLSALGLGGFLSSMLYEVSRTDPTTFAMVPAVAASVALLSAWVPAHRVVRIDPKRALAEE